MNLERLTPIVEQVFKQVLSQNRYPFGVKGGKGNKVASGRLKDSIKAVATKDNTIIVLGPGGKPLNQTYGDWSQNSVNAGRKKGLKGVPIEVLEKWIKQRGLKGRDKMGKFIKVRSFAFAIQTNIKKFGIRPANFLDVAIEDLAQDQRIVDAIGEAAFEELVDLIEGI